LVTGAKNGIRLNAVQILSKKVISIIATERKKDKNKLHEKKSQKKENQKKKPPQPTSSNQPDKKTQPPDKPIPNHQHASITLPSA
ncbi:hypothetical protein, partial [Salmonella enterica]|uniref:hypothetical protein n=1 Tax=Salmonella enterica TaxID=28901 RepID=UPI001F3BACFE